MRTAKYSAVAFEVPQQIQSLQQSMEYNMIGDAVVKKFTVFRFLAYEQKIKTTPNFNFK